MQKTYEYLFNRLAHDEDIEEDDLIAILKECVEIGIDINKEASEIFQRSIRWKEINITNFFIENRLDIDIHDDTLLKGACYSSNLEAVKLFIQMGMKVDNGLISYISGDIKESSIVIEILEILYEHGLDLFHNKNILLCSACRISNIDLIKYLLSKGADCALYNSLPLHYIFSWGGSSEKVLKILLENGADPNLIFTQYNIESDSFPSMSLLEWCIVLAKHDYCKILFEFNVNVNLCKNIMNENYKFITKRKYLKSDIINLEIIVNIFLENGYDISKLLEYIKKLI